MTMRFVPDSAEIVQSLDDPRLLEALESNTYAAYADYAHNSASAVDETPAMLRFISGLPVPLFNGVARVRLDDDDLDAQIESALRPFRERGAPMYWWTTPSTRPTSLADHLVAHGLVSAGSMPGMAMDLSALYQPDAEPGACEVTMEVTPAGLETWSQTAQLGYELPPDLLPALREMTTRLCLGPRPRWMSFLGRVDGRPVSASQLFLHGGVAGVYCVAKPPAARRRGYGAELTRSALRHARDLGYRVGILQASEMGLPIYEDMGFQTLVTFDLYTLPGSGSH